jgi:soluble lytic murein transglycosylase-like protein
MGRIAFCNRCRGMKVGWNLRYMMHCLICKELRVSSQKVLLTLPLLSLFMFAFPTSSARVFSELNPAHSASNAVMDVVPAIPVRDPVVASLKSFLKRYRVDEDQRDRVATAVAATGRKYRVDPLLVASILIVESGANPFAISGSDSIGIMQIHLPTWGNTADKEGINLFKIEDNVDFGVRILKRYVNQYGLWDGVKRYKGWTSEKPESSESADQYVQKVQEVYGYTPPTAIAQ